MALKALISRKWKLDNCSEERERAFREGYYVGKLF